MTKRMYLICFLVLSLAGPARLSAQKAQSDWQIVRACLAMIPVDVMTRQPEKAGECKTILLHIADTTTDPRLLKDIYYALGRYYLQHAYLTTAQDYFVKSLAFFEKEVDTSVNPITKFDYALQCKMLSRAYLGLEMPEKSIAILHQAVRFANVSPYVGNRVYSALVEAYASSGHIDSALYYNNRLLQNTGDDTGVIAEIASADLQIAAYYLNTRDDHKAFTYLQKADTFAARTGSPLLIQQARTMMGRYLEETGDAIRAIGLLEQTLPFARQFNRELYVQALEYMALAQKKKGNTNGSLACYQEYVRQQDSLMKQKSSLTFADLQTRNMADQKKHPTVIPDSKNPAADPAPVTAPAPVQENASPTPFSLIAGLAAALGIISLLGYVLYRSKEKTHRLLNLQSERIRAMEGRLAAAIDTKARLLGRIGHGLRSPVGRLAQLLQLQKDDTTSSDQVSPHDHEDKLRLASERVVESMEELLLWSNSQMEHFTPQFTPVQLQPVIRQELDNLQPLINERGMRVGNDVADTFSRMTDRNIVTIIIRHLLQHAIHSGAEGHTIYIRADGSDLHITYPADLRDGKPSGSRLLIADDLAAAIRAEIIFSQSADGYLTAALAWKN